MKKYIYSASPRVIFLIGFSYSLLHFSCLLALFYLFQSDSFTIVIPLTSFISSVTSILCLIILRTELLSESKGLQLSNLVKYSSAENAEPIPLDHSEVSNPISNNNFKLASERVKIMSCTTLLVNSSNKGISIIQSNVVEDSQLIIPPQMYFIIQSRIHRMGIYHDSKKIFSEVHGP